MTTLTLYYADWCPHCMNFKPTWAELIKWCATQNIKTMSYEDTEIQRMQNESSKYPDIPFAYINGYPTMLVTHNNNIIPVETREFEAIKSMLTGLMVPVIQMGGGTYKEKYLKYKNKYLQLKQSMKM